MLEIILGVLLIAISLFCGAFPRYLQQSIGKKVTKKHLAGIFGLGIALITGAVSLSQENDNTAQEVVLEDGIAHDTQGDQGLDFSTLDHEYGVVIRTVDGDTIKAFVENQEVTVRILGINTPESVDPRRTVECFGKEASQKLKDLLEGKEVALYADPSQDSVDKYGRYLRYVVLRDTGEDIGKILLEDGYAYEYTYKVPYVFQQEYQRAMNEAKDAQRGLWNPSTCNGKK